MLAGGSCMVLVPVWGCAGWAGSSSSWNLCRSAVSAWLSGLLCCGSSLYILDLSLGLHCWLSMVSNELVSLLAPGGSAGLLATELPWVTLVAVLMAGKCYWLVYYVSMLMVYHATLYHHGMPYVASWLLYVMSFISVCCLVANLYGSLRAEQPLSHVARIQTRDLKRSLELNIYIYGVFASSFHV